MATVFLAILSVVEDVRSVHSADEINIYLFFSIAFDSVQARTIWLLPAPVQLSAVVIASIALKLILLLLELRGRRGQLIPEYRLLPLETTSGVFSCRSFWSLNTTLLQGYRTVIKSSGLQSIDSNLAAGSSLAQSNSHRMLNHYWILMTASQTYQIV